MTPLHIAHDQHVQEIEDFLIAHGANKNVKDMQGRKPLEKPQWSDDYYYMEGGEDVFLD